MARINQASQDLLRYNAAILPSVRSSFDKSHSHTTTCDSGYIIPLDWDRVLPGDEKKIRYSGLARMATPLHPVMDEAKFDVFAFFVPDRLWWSHAKEFYGENLDASFNPDGQYVMPYLVPSQYWVDPVKSPSDNGLQSLSDYLGFPLGKHDVAITAWDGCTDLRCSAGLHRSYQIIYNEYFRNSSVQPALRLSTGDNVTGDEWKVISQLRLACKFPDMFTTLLKEPQAGNDVTLPLGDWAPVVTRSENVNLNSFDPNSSSDPIISHLRHIMLDNNADEQAGRYDASLTGDLFGHSYYPGLYNGQATAYATDARLNSNAVVPANLWTNLTDASAVTINNLRAAVTVQHLLEIDALAGKRYQNILAMHFNVFTPDGTVQRPELLGVCRQTVGMKQVLQTSASEADSPQGNTAAFSVTNISNEWICNKAFTEPGFIMVLGVIRPVQSYSQGIDPLLTKLNRYDHYWPVFDNLGNQPMPVSALYCTNLNNDSPSDVSERVMGYSEAWIEYRMRPNRVSGLMRPDIPAGSVHNSLASWNYSTFYSEPQYLTPDFVEEDPTLIDRTIAIPNEPQFIIDSYFDYSDTKNMSVHSVPGLLRL